MAAAASCSFGCLQFGHRFERLDVMTMREGKKRLVARRPVREIGFEDSLDGLRRGFRDNVTKQFAPERGIRPEAAADENVIALNGVVILVLLHLAGEQSDFGYEMLRAGMMAAGEVDIDRRIERDARLAPERDILGMTLGIGRRELAADIAGAGNQPGTDRVGFDRQAERFDFRLRRLQFVARYARNQQVLPDRKPDIAISRSRAISDRPFICATVNRPTGTTTPIQCNPSCFCG